jgi:hypothetical protein
MKGILANHAEDILMFDVPEPLQSVGRAKYKKTWDLFFRYGSPGADVFVIDELRITAGSRVAFATGLLRIGGSKEPICRLTLGLKNCAASGLSSTSTIRPRINLTGNRPAECGDCGGAPGACTVFSGLTMTEARYAGAMALAPR